ncbi:hypothetical protein MauCBS54593_005568 [Microsporum audouinii]
MEGKVLGVDLDHPLRVVDDFLAFASQDACKVPSHFALVRYERYKNTGNIDDINDAIKYVRLAVQWTPEGHPLMASRLNNLGIMLMGRYEGTGSISDLEEAIEVTRQVITSSENHPELAGFLTNLGNQLGFHYDKTGEMKSLEEAISISRRAVELDLSGPNRPMLLNNLSNWLSERYKRIGEMQDLEVAIRLTRQAIELTPEGHPDKRRIWLSNLGNQLENRYIHTGDVADLEAAIQITRQTLMDTPESRPERARIMNDLGNKLESRYERTGNTQDIEEAIQLGRMAIKSTPNRHPGLPRRLNDLANKLENRYMRTGEKQDINESIQLSQQAVNLCPNDLPARMGWLANLAMKLKNRYERTGEQLDLNRAIRAARLSVDRSPDNHPEHAEHLNSLANLLERQYERTDDIRSIEEAIQISRQAVDLTPDDHPDRAIFLTNLGNRLSHIYRRIGEAQTLEEAICLTRQAVELIPKDASSRPSYLNNLGNKLKARYQSVGSIPDLDEAIQLIEQAIDLTPANHPNQVVYLINLGNHIECRYERTLLRQDLARACGIFFRAWYCQNGIPFHRLRAVSRLLKLLPLQGEFAIAAQLAERAIDHLPIINSRSLDLQDRQFVVSMFAGIAADACSLFLDSQKPDQALQSLESGRAVIIGQLVDDRSDISGISKLCPELGNSYRSLLEEVNKPHDDGAPDLEQHVRRRRTAVKELDACIQKIRTLPGYQRYLRNQSIAEMQKCAADGNIIIVNVTTIRSDAIVVTSTSVRIVRLPMMAASEAQPWLQKQWNGSKVERGKKNKEYLGYLSWLWRVCVSPILKHINGFMEPLREEPPRVWWIGSGLASSMPFHAAGDYSSGLTDNAYYTTISSYTPSIKALTHSRSGLSSKDDINGHFLIATMGTTPGLVKLPGVSIEKDGVVQALDGVITPKQLTQPSTDEVLKTLDDCAFVHFACHGYTDQTDPSSSGLIFQKHDGSDLKQDIMTVRDLSKINFKNARIAYLSACSTAENRVAKLIDEEIHVVTGFQVAGFRHVIGCLWPSIDRVCAEVARGFYSSLFRNRNTQWGDIDASKALRESVMEVWTTDLKRPLNWAQFVHYGP